MEGGGYSMFPIRHSLFIPAIRAWLMRRLGVDWPARSHHNVLDTHAGRQTVLAKPRFILAFAGLICIALTSTPHGAGAVTAEVAKKCSALTAKVFPPRVIGNPGAGSVKGSGLEEQAYFKRCLASGGKVGDDDSRD
jgi:hypothetical protein